MENKKNSKGQPIAQNEQPVKFTVVNSETPTTVEELQKRNEELLKKVSELEKVKILKPLKIDEVIKFYEDKKKAIDLLEVFKFKSGELARLHTEVKEQVKNEDFEDVKFSLLIGRGNGRYNENGTININNPIIIDKAIEYIQSAINLKIVTLEAQIQA